MSFLLVRQDNKLLLLKDPRRRFFKTIWSLPYFLQPDPVPQGYINTLMQSGSLQAYPATASHTITHHKITLQAMEVISAKISLESLPQYKWIDAKKLVTEFPSSVAVKLEKIIVKQNE